MRKIYIGIGLTVVLLLVLAGAFAFSLTLQNLRINAASFSQSIVAPAAPAPMTSSDEAEIAAPSSDTVRFEEFQSPGHLCQKDKAPDRATDF